MSNYTKSTNFATKDNLTPGDPLKIVRGTEIDTEYNNIATAIATKTDNASAAIAGGTINGTTIGATTASTGAFTTISASGAITSTLATGTAPLVVASTTKVANLNVDSLDGADWASPAALGSTTPAAVSATTLSASGNVTLSGGTANGVAYLNGSKVVTSGSALVFDGSNLGVGVTPSAWESGWRGFEFKAAGNSLFSGGNSDVRLTSGAYYNAGWKYGVSGSAVSYYYQGAGEHSWYTAPSGTAGNAITFTQAMTLTAAGKLGVGTTGPNETIQAAGTIGSIASSGSNGFVVGDFGSDAGTFTIQAVSGRALRFYDSFAGAERARIDSSGKVLIGTTTNNFASRLVVFNDASYTIESQRTTTASEGHMAFVNANGAVGSIFTSGTATAFNTSSDYRLKNTIAPMTGALAKVALLKPVTYKWNADGSDGQGFIAHELAEVCPDAVTGEKDGTRIEQYEISPAVAATYDEDGNELTSAIEAVMGEREVPQYQGIDVSFLVATLTAAIQELKAEFDAYKASHP